MNTEHRCMSDICSIEQLVEALKKYLDANRFELECDVPLFEEFEVSEESYRELVYRLIPEKLRELFSSIGVQNIEIYYNEYRIASFPDYIILNKETGEVFLIDVNYYADPPKHISVYIVFVEKEYYTYIKNDLVYYKRVL